MLDEFKEELSATMFEEEVEAALSLLRGKNSFFSVSDLRSRMSEFNTAIRKQVFYPEKDATRIINALYRVGIVGNAYFTEEGNLPRQTWANRGYPTPLIDKNFVVHLSIQKVLQTN